MMKQLLPGCANVREFVVNQDLEAGAQVCVNVRSLANTAAVRREKRNGRDVVVVPCATLPDGVVMNGIQYPADEIEKSFRGLEDRPAPLGHPIVNGRFVSALHPEAINMCWIGAWNENLRRENGRVLLDKVIDVERAGQSEGGRAVLNAIDKGEPVHTSTGLLCNLVAANVGDRHKFVARNMEFDHDAILLGEAGAATPEQGVGMMVNSAGKEITVINSAIDEADRDMDWAVDAVARALEKRARAPMLERMKTLIETVFGPEREPSQQQNKDSDMTVSKEQFDALSAEVKTLSESITPEALANAMATAIKPLTDNLAEIQNAQKAKDDAELAGLRQKIVEANVMDETAAGELTLNAARALAAHTEPGKAAALNSAFGGKARDEFADVDLNADMEVK